MTTGQPASAFRYWAFISYSHKDASWGRWLHKALETYRVPRRLVGMSIAAGNVPARLSPVFRDRDELPTTSDLGAAVEDALSQSWCLIVICSPESAQSRWVNEEVLAFQRLGRGDRIHCLIVDGDPDPAAPIHFPPALEQAQSADGNGKSEPVAADARHFGDGRNHALLKLIAGILGIRYDTLAQREQQRKHRNLFWITCASLALVVVLAVSTLVAVTSRREAVDQRGHAEGLVEFMIGDLRKKLEPDGKLATLDAVGKEALAYYSTQKSEDLDADGLARRARALHMIGEVYDLRGELDEALKVFEQAADSTAELLAREPGNGQRVFDHAQSVFWVGNIAYQRGNSSIAVPAFQEYKRLAVLLVAMNPSNHEWQAEVGYANSNLGTLLYEQGRLDEAASIFESELDSASAKKLELKIGDEFNQQMRIAQALANLANIRYVQGRLRESANLRQNVSSIYEQSILKNPHNNDGRESLSISERSLGRILLELGDTNQAMERLKNSVELATMLVATDPDNANWMESAAAAHTTLAEAFAFAGKDQLAVASGAAAQSLAESLTRRDPSVIGWQLRWLKILLFQARRSLDSGDPQEAMKLSAEIARHVENLPSGQLRDWERSNVLVQSLLLLGMTNHLENNVAEARNAWLRIPEIVGGNLEASIPKNQAALALSLCGLGSEEQATPIIECLREMGYREPSFLKDKDQLCTSTIATNSGDTSSPSSRHAGCNTLALTSSAPTNKLENAHAK